MGKGKAAIVSVLGWSDTGKTCFIEAAVAECRRRGVSAAAIKKSHNVPDLPPGSKDSSRFRRAGAEPSIYLSGTEMLALMAAPARLDGKSIAALCPGASIIFCEGLEVDGAQLVLMAGDVSDESALKRKLSEIDIIVARNAIMLELAGERGVKNFKADDIGLFIDYLIATEDSHE
jgi:molybdopterin-guanine dinucleotide biosynthesis protein MobB